MPVATGLIHGNVPLDIELNQYGEVMGYSIHHATKGACYLDLTDDEMDTLEAANASAIRDEMADYYRRNGRKELRSSYREDELKAGGY
jgi:hypothetical protein